MPIVSIIGAGPIGASIAHRLAERDRVGPIALIDSSGSVAAGKALDIVQSGPITSFDTRICTADDELAAVSSPIIVIADDSAEGPWDGERGLALVSRLARAGTQAALVFAAPSQTWLMEKAYGELRLPADRLIGTAASAIPAAVRALAGLEIDAASVEATVVGRPPALVIGWSAATADGVLLTDRVPAHRLLAISQALPRIWPPAPYAIASATAPVVEALASGARRLLPALTVVDGDLGARGRAVLLPLDLGEWRVRRHVVPTLSTQERTELEGSLASRPAGEAT